MLWNLWSLKKMYLSCLKYNNSLINYSCNWIYYSETHKKVPGKWGPKESEKYLSILNGNCLKWSSHIYRQQIGTMPTSNSHNVEQTGAWNTDLQILPFWNVINAITCKLNKVMRTGQQQQCLKLLSFICSQPTLSFPFGHRKSWGRWDLIITKFMNVASYNIKP